MPFQMNKMDITVNILSNETEFDDVFREPSAGGRVYDEFTVVDFAQFKNTKFEKLDYSDPDNNSLATKARLAISKVDWDFAKDVVGFELKKGDLITKVGLIETKLRVDEVKPTGFLRGEHTLYFVELVDHNVVLGGVY